MGAQTPAPQTAYKYSLAIAVLGVLASFYLLVHHIRLHLGMQQGTSFCSINQTFDCDRVAMSSYSEFAGVPVAAWGLFYYLLWLLILRMKWERIDSAETWAMLRFLALCGLGPVIVLASLSLTQLQTICLVCAFTYLVTLALGALAFRVKTTEPRLPLSTGARSFIALFVPLKGSRFDIGFVLTVLLCAAGVLILPAVMLEILKTPEPIESSETPEERGMRLWRGEPVAPAALKVVSDGPDRDFELGDPEAKVTVTTYSDFGCPHCQVVGSFLEKLAAELPIRVIFKDFPLDRHCNPLVDGTFHDSSCEAAQLARCAGAADTHLFWKAHDLLFSQEKIDEQTLAKVEGELRKDVPDIAECVHSGRQMPAVSRHVNEGIALKLPGTPGVFVEGKHVEAVNAGMLRKMIEESMRRKSAPSP